MNNSITSLPLYSNEGKIIGLSLASLGILSIVANHFNIITFPYYHAIILAGLLLNAFSKERFEDDSINKLRHKAFKIGFLIMLFALLGLQITWINVHSVPYDAVTVIPYFSIGFYLLTFNILLMKKKVPIENNLSEHIKNNPKFHFLYTFILLCFILLSILIQPI